MRMEDLTMYRYILSFLVLTMLTLLPFAAALAALPAQGP